MPEKRRPFHETIVDAINRCSTDPLSGQISQLFMMIMETSIPKDHDKIIDALNEKFSDCPGCSRPRLDEVIQSIMVQILRPVKKAAEKKKKSVADSK